MYIGVAVCLHAATKLSQADNERDSSENDAPDSRSSLRLSSADMFDILTLAQGSWPQLKMTKVLDNLDRFYLNSDEVTPLSSLLK